MKINDKNNFCRVFELPTEYPRGFCFGGKSVQFQMVDWFNPIPLHENPNMTWEEAEPLLRDFLKDKIYVKPGRKYVLITEFGKSFVF